MDFWFSGTMGPRRRPGEIDDPKPKSMALQHEGNDVIPTTKVSGHIDFTPVDRKIQFTFRQFGIVAFLTVGLEVGLHLRAELICLNAFHAQPGPERQ